MKSLNKYFAFPKIGVYNTEITKKERKENMFKCPLFNSSIVIRG
jgi:hypothetical protein